MTTIPAVSGRDPDQIPDQIPDKILARQRSAILRDGPLALQQRRADLKKLRAAVRSTNSMRI